MGFQRIRSRHIRDRRQPSGTRNPLWKPASRQTSDDLQLLHTDDLIGDSGCKPRCPACAVDLLVASFHFQLQRAFR